MPRTQYFLTFATCRYRPSVISQIYADVKKSPALTPSSEVHGTTYEIVDKTFTLEQNLWGKTLKTQRGDLDFVTMTWPKMIC